MWIQKSLKKIFWSYHPKSAAVQMDCRLISRWKYLRQLPLHCLLSSISLWLQGFFSDWLKIAKVIPLFKKEGDHVIDNYRPIFDVMYFENCRQNELLFMFTITLQSKLMSYDSQYGCRKIFSTELAALNWQTEFACTWIKAKFLCK